MAPDKNHPTSLSSDSSFSTSCGKRAAMSSVVEVTTSPPRQTISKSWNRTSEQDFRNRFKRSEGDDASLIILAELTFEKTSEKSVPFVLSNEVKPEWSSKEHDKIKNCLRITCPNFAGGRGQLLKNAVQS